MAHRIFSERFVGIRQPAWHGLGVILEEPVPPIEGLKIANADFEFHKLPLGFTDPAGQFITTGDYSLVREPTSDDPIWRPFGVVRDRYEIIQNSEIASALEPIAEVFPLETVGVLDFGKTLFITLDAGATEIGGEAVKSYFLVKDTKDGKSGLQIAFTPVRVVCGNTLSIGLKKATISSSLTHNTNARVQFPERVNIFKVLNEAKQLSLEHLERFAEVKLTQSQTNKYFEKAYPYPTKPASMQLHDQLNENVSVEVDQFTKLVAGASSAERKWNDYKRMIDARREAAEVSLQLMNEANPQLANTVWYAYNAVVEVEDYRKGGSDEGKTLTDTLFGSRARTKRQAFNLATDLVNRK